MSLIHLEKSVLTFHLKEIIEDGHGNHPLTWLSLGLVILAPKLLPAVAKNSQPIAKNLPKSKGIASRNTPISLSQWIAEAENRGVKNELNYQNSIALERKLEDTSHSHR
ncbi:MAG: hypothetical protein MUE44_36025 [Oscillatoriaceae cyanobacterium Prado104]|jgi:hypothetical protein|nr:hypothetical protein [Oscillatoriaceae cyanobacterium Prado104]